LSAATSREELEELIELERSCCAWMRLDLKPTDGGWILGMSADAEEGIRAIRRIAKIVGGAGPRSVKSKALRL
jgi:hypothetical protein